MVEETGRMCRKCRHIVTLCQSKTPQAYLMLQLSYYKPRHFWYATPRRRASRQLHLATVSPNDSSGELRSSGRAPDALQHLCQATAMSAASDRRANLRHHSPKTSPNLPQKTDSSKRFELFRCSGGVSEPTKNAATHSPQMTAICDVPLERRGHARPISNLGRHPFPIP